MRRIKGFTLIELLTCLAIAAGVLFFSVVLTKSIYNKNHFQRVTNEVKNIIQFAKLQALIQGKNLALTPLKNSQDWSKGMLLFVDNKLHRYTGSATLIQAWHWPTSATKITWQGFQGSHYLLFSADIRHSAINGFFLLNNETQSHKLVINRLGRIREQDVS